MTDKPALQHQLAKSGRFFVTKVKRAALDFSDKWLAQLAAGVSALVIQTLAATWFDYELSVPVATIVASGVTIVVGALAGYVKSEKLKLEAVDIATVPVVTAEGEPISAEDALYPEQYPDVTSGDDSDPTDRVPGPDHRA
jgi:hypothetical protein